MRWRNDVEKNEIELITSLLEILLFVCISFIIIVPLLIMILGSFKDATEVTAFNLELPSNGCLRTM
mgnify:CR=1 FL=1